VNGSKIKQKFTCTLSNIADVYYDANVDKRKNSKASLVLMIDSDRWGDFFRILDEKKTNFHIKN
jgi:hypothetical protein